MQSVYVMLIFVFFARFSHCLGVCLSVRYTRDLYQNGARYHEIFTPRSLVFRNKISCPWVKRFPSNEGVKEGVLPKRRYFAIIGSYSVKTIADRYRLANHCNNHW